MDQLPRARKIVLINLKAEGILDVLQRSLSSFIEPREPLQAAGVIFVSLSDYLDQVIIKNCSRRAEFHFSGGNSSQQIDDELMRDDPVSANILTINLFNDKPI